MNKKTLDSDRDYFPESVGDLVQYAFEQRPQVTPSELGRVVTEMIYTHYEGEQVRIRKSVKQRQQRDHRRARVRAEFNGRNVAELVEKYGVSRATLYRWIK